MRELFNIKGIILICILFLTFLISDNLGLSFKGEVIISVSVFIVSEIILTSLERRNVRKTAKAALEEKSNDFPSSKN